jgi:nucleoside 2-deoxyribosyltransferase
MIAPKVVSQAHQISYWDSMRNKPAPHRYPIDVYLAGSLRNPHITSLTEQLSTALSMRVFSDWYAAGPEADDYWKSYYTALGYSYTEALKQPASKHVFEFDKKHIDMSAVMVLVLPAGKSGHLELGYHLGKGKPGYILLDGADDRFDVMYQFATGVANDVDELIHMIQHSGGAV